MERQRRTNHGSTLTTYLKETVLWAVTLGVDPTIRWRGMAGAANPASIRSTPSTTCRAVAMIVLFQPGLHAAQHHLHFRRALTVRKSLGLIAFVYAPLHLVNPRRAGLRL